MRGQRCRDGRRQVRAAGVYQTDRLHQLVVEHILGEVRAGAGLQRATDLFVARVRAERDEARLWRALANRAHGIHSAHDRHPDVHQRHVRAVLLVQLHGLGAVGGFGHHLHVRLRLDDGPDTDAGDQVILGDQHAD